MRMVCLFFGCYPRCSEREVNLCVVPLKMFLAKIVKHCDSSTQSPEHQTPALQLW